MKPESTEIARQERLGNVLELHRQGLGNKQIAKQLGVSNIQVWRDLKKVLAMGRQLLDEEIDEIRAKRLSTLDILEEYAIEQLYKSEDVELIDEYQKIGKVKEAEGQSKSNPELYEQQIRQFQRAANKRGLGDKEWFQHIVQILREKDRYQKGVAIVASQFSVTKNTQVNFNNISTLPDQDLDEELQKLIDITPK